MLEEMLNSRREDLKFIDTQIATLGGKRADIIDDIKQLQSQINKETVDLWNLKLGQNIVMIPKDNMCPPHPFYRGFTVVTERMNGYGVTEWKFNESAEDTSIIFHNSFITTYDLKKFENDYRIFVLSDEKSQELLLRFIKLDDAPSTMWSEIYRWVDKHALIEISRESGKSESIVES